MCENNNKGLTSGDVSAMIWGSFFGMMLGEWLQKRKMKKAEQEIPNEKPSLWKNLFNIRNKP